MKPVSSALLICFFVALIACDRFVTDPPPLKETMPYFNQVNTEFGTDQIQCLLDQWYAAKYQNEPITLRVIDDEVAYKSFFACKPGIDLPAIDFTSKTLLVGMKSDQPNLINTPINITGIVQNLVKKDDDSFALKVTVKGKANQNQLGGEWFGFTSVIPKIKSPVVLEMTYVFE